MALKGHGATVRYVTLPHESHTATPRASRCCTRSPRCSAGSKCSEEALRAWHRQGRLAERSVSAVSVRALPTRAPTNPCIHSHARLLALAGRFPPRSPPSRRRPSVPVTIGHRIASGRASTASCRCTATRPGSCCSRSRLASGVPLPGVAPGRRGLEPDRSRPGSDGRFGARDVRAGRPEGADDRSRTTATAPVAGRGGAAGRGAVVRTLRPVGIQGRSGRGLARPGRRHRLLPARRPRRRRSPAPVEAGARTRWTTAGRRSTWRARRGSRRTRRSRRR